MKKIMLSAMIAVGSLAISSSAYSYTPSLKSASGAVYSPRIIGGKEAEQNKYPFMTALIVSGVEDIRLFCGASFIGGRYVLTATHCVDGVNAQDIDVWIGGHDVNDQSSGKRVKVAQIYQHEFYDVVSANNDVAILELVEEVQGVTPVNIITPELEATLSEGFEFTVMGWGRSNSLDQPFPDKLHEVNVPLYNRAQCLNDYTRPGASESEITEQMLCAGFVDGGKDSCQGDSGGPLVFEHNNKWYQAGVVSFGNGCAEANAPGIYSRLSQFNQWISEKTAGVSYQQNTKLGFVEKAYEEDRVFTFKNVSQSEYMVTKATITSKENIDVAEVIDNACALQHLAFNDSCAIKVKVKTNRLGEGKFTLTIDTDHPLNKQARLFFSTNSLEQEPLDMPALVGSDKDYIRWWGGGDANWQVSTNQTVKGNTSAASGDITHGQSTVLLATIDNDRIEQFSLKYLVSSEEGYDFLQILHNDRVILNVSGISETEFKHRSIKLGEGTDRLAFIYQKDSSDVFDSGDDKAYIDDVSIVIKNTAPVIVLKQTDIQVEEGQSFTLDASGSSDPELDQFGYQWQVISVDKIALSNDASASLSLTAPAYKDVQALRFKVTATDALGSSSSAEVGVTITQKPKSGGSLGLTLLPLLMLSARRKWRK